MECARRWEQERKSEPLPLAAELNVVHFVCGPNRGLPMVGTESKYVGAFRFFHISLEALTKPKPGLSLRKGCIRFRSHTCTESAHGMK